MPASKKTKKSIPKAVRDQVWVTYVGKKYSGSCFCCNKEINVNAWHCGHVIAESKGGPTTVENLRPLCSTCNLSMGTTDIKTFKARHFTKTRAYRVKRIMESCVVL